MMRMASALFARECASVAASRVVWVFLPAGIAAGFAVASGGAEGRSAVWLALPPLLYLVPPLGLLVGVAAARSDLDEEPMLQPRAPSLRIRLAVKCLLWAALVTLVALTWLLPATLAAGEPARLLPLAGQAGAESAVFVALGLCLGRSLRDGVAAHVGALLLGGLFVAGAGVLGWLAAGTPFFQAHPGLWTLGLMLHPVEALRVGLMFSLEDLPVDASRLPPLAAWWLARTGLWYAGLAAVWTGLALFLGGMRRP